MAEFELQDIVYGEDSPPIVVEAIKQRVSVIEDEIVLLNEIRHVSPFSINIVFNEMKQYASELENCGYLIDITNTNVPDAKTRRVINNEFKHTLGNVKHVAFVTGKNFIINTAARFVMYQTSLNSFSIVKDRNQGIADIHKVLKKF